MISMHRFVQSLPRHLVSLSIRKCFLGSSPSFGSNGNEEKKLSESYWYQKRKQDAMKGPRFENTDLSAQPWPMPSIDLINEQPIKKVHQRIVACDGGMDAGHPRVFINLDQPGSHSCGYCGLRFELEHHH